MTISLFSVVLASLVEKSDVIRYFHNCYYSFVIQGLLADKLGSYVLPFQIAGGITLAGAFIPFMLLCTNWRDRTKSILDETEGENLEGVA